MTVQLSPIRAAALCRFWDVTLDPLEKWRRRQEAARFICPAPANQTHRLGQQVCDRVEARLEQMGYTVNQTTHKSSFDLWVDGRLHIEVKAANWTRRANPRYGRFQAHLGRSQIRDADLVIFGCKNGTWHYFVIPADQITGPTLDITSYDVKRYAGRYAPYLEAWDLIEIALHTARRCHQMELFKYNPFLPPLGSWGETNYRR